MVEQEASQVSQNLDGSVVEIQKVLNTLSIGMMLLKVNGEVVFTNRAAKTIIENKSWLHLADGRLRVQSSQNNDFEKSIRLALEHQSSEENSKVLLQGEDSKDSLLLAFTSVGAAGFVTPHDTVLGIIVDPNHDQAADVSLLRRIYALTEAESNITALLARGLNYSEIAEQRNVSISTIRSYTKTIFKKLRVNSRTGVVRKVNAISIPLESTIA